MKVTLPLLAIFAGFAAAKLPGDATANQLDNNGVDTNTIDDSSLTGPNYCPVGKTCYSDRECGSCICNNWTNKCQEIHAEVSGEEKSKIPNSRITGNKDKEIETNEIDVQGPNYCPVGKTCYSDRECGSCTCNNWTNKCQE